MAFIGENGAEITDAMVDQWAQDAERGDFGGTRGEIFVGRPPLCDEELTLVTFKIQPSVLKKVDAVAKQRGVSRSEIIRTALCKEVATA